MANQWAIVNNETSIVERTIVGDGVTPYTPPEGTTLYEFRFDHEASAGFIRNEDGSFTPPPAEE